MTKDEVTEPEQLSLEEFIKKFEQFKGIYVNDIQALNRILSTYEDKISMLEGQIYDLSFKLKQLNQTVSQNNSE